MPRNESTDQTVAVKKKKPAIPQNVVYQQNICNPHSGLICNNCKFLSFVCVALVWWTEIFFKNYFGARNCKYLRPSYNISLCGAVRYRSERWPTAGRLTTTCLQRLNLSNPTGHVMHHQFNIQQLYALPTLYLCVLYLSENKQRLVPLTA